jgi:hypothetical protein
MGRFSQKTENRPTLVHIYQYVRMIYSQYWNTWWLAWWSPGGCFRYLPEMFPLWTPHDLRIGIGIPNFGLFSGWSQCLYPEGQTQETMCTKYASTLMATQTYHTRMCFHPNFLSSFLFSCLGHPFRVTHPVPIRLLEFSSKHMYRNPSPQSLR